MSEASWWLEARTWRHWATGWLRGCVARAERAAQMTSGGLQCAAPGWMAGLYLPDVDCLVTSIPGTQRVSLHCH
jgi:hypothetical protein